MKKIRWIYVEYMQLTMIILHTHNSTPRIVHHRHTHRAQTTINQTKDFIWEKVVFNRAIRQTTNLLKCGLVSVMIMMMLMPKNSRPHFHRYRFGSYSVSNDLNVSFVPLLLNGRVNLLPYVYAALQSIAFIETNAWPINKPQIDDRPIDQIHNYICVRKIYEIQLNGNDGVQKENEAPSWSNSVSRFFPSIFFFVLFCLCFSVPRLILQTHNVAVDSFFTWICTP